MLDVEKGEEEPIYGDLEVEDFNQLFVDSDRIRKQFGETIKVKLNI